MCVCDDELVFVNGGIIIGDIIEESINKVENELLMLYTCCICSNIYLLLLDSDDNVITLNATLFKTSEMSSRVTKPFFE